MSENHYPMSKHKFEEKDSFIRRAGSLFFLILYILYMELESFFERMKERFKKR